MTTRANDTVTVIRATTADADTLSQVVADAFHDLAPSRWLLSHSAGRRAVFPTYFGLLVAHALDIGVVHTTHDRAAAALWVPVPESGPSQPADYKHQMAVATRPWTHRFVAFDETLDRHYPTGTAHHHLAILAVRPDRQGHGVGTALLRAHHATLDRNEGIPAYLEAANQRTRQLYLAHGYHDHGGPIELPDGPSMYPMWREPRPSPAELRSGQISRQITSNSSALAAITSAAGLALSGCLALPTGQRSQLPAASGRCPVRSRPCSSSRAERIL